MNIPLLADEPDNDSASNLKVAFFLNLGFSILELAGGLLTNSVAILADVIHVIGHSTSLGVAWYLEHYSRKGQDSHYSFGYHRFGLLGAIFSATVLLGGALLVLSQAIPRIIHPQPTYAPGMVLFAILAIAVYGTAFWRVKGSVGYNAQVAAWNLLQDVIGWIAILVVSIAMIFNRDWHLLDPLLSVIIAIVILINAIRAFRKTFRVLLQATPEYVSLPYIKHKLESIEQVQSAHDTHIWSLDGIQHVLTTHLVVDPHTTREEIKQVKKQVRALARDWSLRYVTVEVEYADVYAGSREVHG